MKVWIRGHRRSAVLVALTLLLPLYFFLAAMTTMLAARGEYREQIDNIEPRVARMQGLVAKEDEIAKSLAGVNTIARDHIYPRSSAAEAVAASLQAEARRILSDAGMQVTNSQIQRPRKRDQFDYVAVKIVARGTLAQLDQGLSELDQFRPVIFVESLDAFPNRRRRKQETATQLLTVSMQLLSLRSVL
ncbi:type II secretion system protein GspM [Luminiphilus sp. nBUS_16]|uniref:type II secretion system protein GspM n=1 Tax=Luminiphilus sp. nBUS_16 TaxID=3395315 RepID=UPI003EB81ACB